MPHAVAPWFVAVALPCWRRPARALERLAWWCMRFTPRVHLEQAGDAVAAGMPMVLLDASGCLRVHGGADRLARRVGRGLARRGIVHAQAGAPCAGEAMVRAAACGLDVPRGPCGCPVADPAVPIDRLPLDALRMPSEACAALRELNVRCIGDLRAISRASLADRFGPEPLERLDMADGRIPWPFRPVVPPAPCAESFDFASPCCHPEAVALACRDALDRLCRRLGAQGQGAGAVRVRIERARLPPVEGVVHLGMPSRDPAHLWAILRPRLERVHLGRHELAEGIERIELAALRRARLVAATPSLAGIAGTVATASGIVAVADAAAAADARVSAATDPAAAATAARAVAELADRLRARLGDGMVRFAHGAAASPQ